MSLFDDVKARIAKVHVGDEPIIEEVNFVLMEIEDEKEAGNFAPDTDVTEYVVRRLLRDRGHNV